MSQSQDLSAHPAKRAELWQLARLKGRPVTPTDIVGRCVVHGVGGQSTEIVGYDARTQRVLTRSGSVYQLGTPNLAFALCHVGLMEKLGFVTQ